MHKELNSDFWILSFFSNWRISKSFSLGLNLSSEVNEKLDEGMSFEKLNYDIPLKTIRKREYYLCLSLGFWQLSFGVRI